MNWIWLLDKSIRPYARELIRVGQDEGIRIRVTSTRRSHSEQARLYREYLAGRRAYPAAPPGASAHERGLAFDLVTEPYAGLWRLGQIWNYWGGSWSASDAVHFGLR